MNRKSVIFLLALNFVPVLQTEASQDANKEQEVVEKKLQELVVQLQDANSVIRKNACLSIEKYGVQAVKAIPLLEQIVSTDPVPEIKVEAGWVLKSISGKIQAIKMPTVNKESIYSRRFHINSEGKLKSIIFPQVFEQTGGFISAKTENSVLVITDERKPPKSQLYAIAMYGKENHQTICF
jgi:hypothetical protein